MSSAAPAAQTSLAGDAYMPGADANARPMFDTPAAPASNQVMPGVYQHGRGQYSDNPAGMGFAQEIESLHAQIRAACPAAADGVLIAGTGFRCVGLIDALEQDLARPVVTANQASLWHCLRRSGVGARIPGYGQLLSS